jgi:4-amino-4-deoxy-L-arabinose transferase-like glycosyltransferase
MIIFPFLFWIITYFVFIKLLTGDRGFYTLARESFVWATLTWGALAIAITEALSLFKAISVIPLGMAWAAASLVTLMILYKFRSKSIDFKAGRLSLDLFSKLLLGVIAAILLLTAVVAFVAPPNNYDSMTYHMSRVMHWAQNQSVAHYPTHILRQLSMPPAAEFAILQFQVLLGSDYLANFVQWFCMLGSLILITLIAKLLGANYRGQILSAFVGATIPMGILQATSTQTDYVTSFWILCFVYFVIKFKSESRFEHIGGASLALGLAVLTKPTACLIAFPFGLWLVILLLRRRKWNLWRPLLVMLLVVMLINSGYFLRNLSLFGSFLGSDHGTVNEAFLPGNLASNILKYFAQHLNSPFPSFNASIYAGLKRLHDVSGIDINDNRTSFEEFTIEKYTPHEDVAGSLVHLFLIFVCGFLFFYRGKPKNHPDLLAYFTALVAGFLIFFGFIKYQPWLNRLTLPIFVLFSPLIGIILNKMFAKRIQIAVFALMIMVAIPPLLMNITRPLIPPPFARRSKYSILTTPRQYFYFAGMPETYRSYKRVADTIKKRKYSNIGVGGINNEYPLWVLLDAAGIKYRLEHVEVENVSRSIQTDFKPEAVLFFGSNPPVEAKYKIRYRIRDYPGKDDFDRRIMLYGR